MRIEELSEFGIPEEYIEKFKGEKILELYPPQADIIKKGLFKDRNLLVSLPTAGGKTFIATLAIIHRLLESKRKIVYISPLVALTYEKYEYFKKIFDNKYKVAISVGDLDSNDPWLNSCDIICCTVEKLDSLLRRNVPWIGDLGLIVVDEVHLLNDPSRGPTLEVLLTKLKEIAPHSQIFALSATVKNSAELAKWLNASLVLSDFRPVKLYEGVAFNSEIQFFGKDSYKLSDLDVEDAIVENTLQLKKQCLVFVSTRRSAESLASKLAKTTRKHLTNLESEQLEKISDNVLNVLESPTEQCEKISTAVKHGVAFHHAGLLRKQKSLIEDNFRNGLVKVIVSTPTLALGVNLPAFRVVIRDAKRYYDSFGSGYIPVLEYKQMIGRAGRPQYDSFGESILVAKDENSARELTEHFINGEVEDIYSKLAVEPILRMHSLALIASEFTKTQTALKEFFSKTFYALQYGNISAIEDKIFEILGQLVEWGFVEVDGDGLEPTRLGKRVSELYIDPLTAHNFIESLNVSSTKQVTDFGILQLISNTLEMRPLLNVKSNEIEDFGNVLSIKENEFLQSVPDEWDFEFEEFFKSVKTASMFEDWINESMEEKLLEKYKVAPGELKNRLDTADWLLYSLHELSLLSGKKDMLNYIRKTRVRTQYGIKEELLPLVKLKDIGRVRARRLYSAGLTTLQNLRDVPIESLEKLVGMKVAKSVKDQLSGKKAMKEPEQTKLGSFE